MHRQLYLIQHEVELYVEHQTKPNKSSFGIVNKHY